MGEGEKEQGHTSKLGGRGEDKATDLRRSLGASCWGQFPR